MAGTITHSWKGTVLTISSDAGTSSADLGGATGCRGPQGRPGVVYDEEGKILCDSMASLEELEAGLNRYDNETLIRDENGNLMTAIGGSIREKKIGQLVTGDVNVAYTKLDISNIHPGPYSRRLVCQPVGMDFTLFNEDEAYDVRITLSNGAEMEMKNLFCVNKTGAVADNDYFIAVEIQPSTNFIYLYIETSEKLAEWNPETLKITSLEAWSPDYIIYNPMDARALPIDSETIVINKDGFITLSEHGYATIDYVDTAINDAVFEGVSLDDYYTKAQVDALVKQEIAKEIAKIASSEGVEY